MRAAALNCAAMFACYRVDYTTAYPLYEECLVIQRELGDEQGSADTLSGLGLIKRELGDPVTALRLLEEKLAIQQKYSDRHNSANTIYFLGCIAGELGDITKARLYLEEAHTIDLEFGNKAGHATGRLGDVLCMQGDYTGARSLLIESLEAGWELDNKLVAMYSLEYLAWLAYSQGQGERAGRLYGTAEALRTAIGFIFPPSDQHTHSARTTEVRTALGDAAFNTAWEQGRSLSLEQCIDYGLSYP